MKTVACENGHGVNCFNVLIILCFNEKGVPGFDRGFWLRWHTEDALRLANHRSIIISANLFSKAKVAVANLFAVRTFAPVMA